jgi:S1-C subfamily serine protease
MAKCFGILEILVVLGFASLGCHYAYCQPIDYTDASTAKKPDAPGDGLAHKAPEEKLSAAEIERRVAAVYDRVGPSVLRGNQTGVVVTAEGHVLIPAVVGGSKLTFQLPDGRRATATTLGWSKECGIGLAKLDEPGPWPHVKLGGPAGVRAGQCIVTLGYLRFESPTLVRHPLLDVGWVTRGTPGIWFMTPQKSTVLAMDAAVVFDLDGNVAGVASSFYWENGMVYTDAKVVQTLWADLAAGKNVDQVRLVSPQHQVEGRPDSRDRAAINAIPQVAEQKATAATVRICRGPEDPGFSGVIVSEDGLVATCGHTFALPGSKVIVCLPDGRDASGKVVGINPVCDIGLVRILDPGPWPRVEMGESIRLRSGDPCLSIGFGAVNRQDRQPRVRKSSVVARELDPWDHWLGTDPSVSLLPGDSGGGIFDADGRLVAIHRGVGGEVNGVTPPHTHARVELFRRHWDELHAPSDETTASPLATAKADLGRAADVVRRSVVEILDDQNPVALGTVVGRQALILTKASALPEAPRCRLFDGRVLPATVVRTDRAHDLATLKIPATDLPVAQWSNEANPRTGTMIAMAGYGGELAVGFVSHSPLSIPPDRGALWVTLRDSPMGLEVAELQKQPFGPSQLPPSPFHKGDVILTIDGHAITDLKGYSSLIEPEEGDPIAIAGDRLRVVVVREGKKVELRPLLGPQVLPRPDGQSPRYSGFPTAYSVAVDAKSPLGGPVLDRTGRVMGVAIAWRGRGWLLVVPAATAKTVAGELK